MNSDTDIESSFVVLDTGLFNDTQTLSAAVQLLDIPPTHTRTLVPDKMTDGDWDDILSLVLSTKRVITL
ncbi:hypothetical protein AB833_05410 [Chromatiales bacterium (ex Bugula neritina AB1)]|nr:hypothetical protein AB833_05410 [Chromatiales bacterium (ex Bugula neritina AB1)]